MATEVSLTTLTGVASCVLGCGCWVAAAVQGEQAKQLRNAKPIHLSDLKELLPLVPLLVAVSGKAWAAKPVRCETDSQVEAVYAEVREFDHTSERADDGRWLRRNHLTRYSSKVPDWFVKDKTSGVRVCDANLAHSLYLADIGQIWTDPPNSAVGQVVDVLTGRLQLLGRSKVEKALPVGTSITVVGELAHTGTQAQRVGDLSQLALRKPQKGGPFIISRQPYGDILTDYEASSHAWRLCAYGCGALGVTLLGIKVIAFGLRKYREHSTRRRVRRVEERRAAARQASGGGDLAAPALADNDDRESDTCVICLDRRCQTVFQSCGHMCTCLECSRSLNRCPICRTKTRAITVYRP